MRKLVVILLALLVVEGVSGAEVKEVMVYSEAMKKEVPVMIAIPDSYSKSGEYPIIVMLHGYSANHKEWISEKFSVEKWADIMDVIIVSGDGDYNSWYFDSPIKKENRYETFYTKELIDYMAQNYSTIDKPEARAIAGLSMGGHGALYLAIRNQDVYGAAGSMAGAVDVRMFATNRDLVELLGSYEGSEEVWEQHAVIGIIDKVDPERLVIRFDCGADDFFHSVNEDLHKKMIELKIPHTYTSAPGNHNSAYWNNMVDYHMVFFQKHFQNKLARD